MGRVWRRDSAPHAQEMCKALKKRAVCEKGSDVELLTAAEMGAIEQAAIKSGTVTGAQLMERAGRGVVDAIFGEWPPLAAGSHHAVVLCGPGNNGGDGYVVARLLKEKGWEIGLAHFGDPGKLPPDAKANYERAIETGLVPIPFNRLTNAAILAADVIVDALFGTGLTRGLPDDLARCAQSIDTWRNARPAGSSPRVVAVDMPSGISSDTGDIVAGAARRVAFRADLTVTFHSRKLGHTIGSGPDHSGHVVVKDIGL